MHIRTDRIPGRLVSTLALALALSGPAVAAPGPGDGPVAGARPASVHAPRMKQVQRVLLMQGARRKIAAARERARHHGVIRPGQAVRLRKPSDRFEAGGPQGIETNRAARPSAVTRTAGLAALGPNVRANGSDPLAGVGQAEEMIGVHGADVLVAWNDGIGFSGANGHTQGYGWSRDGGATWTDGGAPPVLGDWRWASDPLVTVNERTGEFWYCALVDRGLTENGIAIARGTFGGGTLQWSVPTLVRHAANSALFFDKPWLAADSLTGRLYLSYSVFTSNADTIVFQRSSASDPLNSWDAPQRLSSNAEAGFVQGSRPVVGPDGELYVVWYSIGSVDADYMRIRRSTDQGASFGSSVTLASLFSNYGSGAPGFNRGMGITYPSIAVDRSAGPNRGRVYVAWNESVNFYDDDLGGGAVVVGDEPDEIPQSASPFTPGATVRGTISSADDFDYYRFEGTAGQTVILFTDSLSGSLNMSLRLFCGDGATRLSFSAPGAGLNNVVVFTLPASGTYYMRAVSYDGSTGGYRIRTGLDTHAGERARDHRDVFVTWSDNGGTWSTPVLAGDSPAGFDDWLPEVAVAGTSSDPQVGSGRPYVAWYDWRDSPGVCGGASHVYLARSDDFGGSWGTAGVVTDAQTAWTNTQSDIIPNQGDYIALLADTSSVYVSWADGRSGDPDVYVSRIPLLTATATVALTSIRATGSTVTVSWYVGRIPGFTGAVQRRDSTAGTGYVTLGPVTADAGGHVTFVDDDVAPGHRYAYRLTWVIGDQTFVGPDAWIEVPVVAPFSLSVDRSRALTGEGVWVSFTLPDRRFGTLLLLDVTGRRVAERRVDATSFSTQLAEGDRIGPGIYFVRLTQGGRSLNARVVVVR